MVDARAASGFSASAVAYDRARPSFPEGAVAAGCDALELGPESHVLDLAAGTGKLTRPLAARVDRLVAVEPSDRMRAVLEASLPGVEALAGEAEAIPIGDAEVDGVFVSEAFHWFRAHEAALEIARVLRPGGGLAVLFNEPCWTEVDHPWLAEFRSLMQPYRAAAGPWPSRKGEWRDEVIRSGRYGPVAERRFEHTQHLSGEGFVDMVSSWSWIANLEERERTEVLERVRRMVGGELALQYETALYVLRLR